LASGETGLRIASLAVALATTGIVLWMASFGPRAGRLYSEGLRAPLPAAEAPQAPGGPGRAG